MSDKIRPSKAIMTHGPGALIDLQEGRSGIIMSPDYWNKYTIINDKRLAGFLGVKHFRTPAQGLFETENGQWRKAGIIFNYFPNRWYCPECRLLLWASFETCRDCSQKLGKPVHLVVPRLVAACQGGHIQDFPWKAWIKCKCSGNEIKLMGSKKSSSDMVIKCGSCNSESDLRGALGTLKQFNCRGHRPWIGDSAHEKCRRKLHGLMKGASNTYFPRTASSILIPPYSSRILSEIMSLAEIETVQDNYHHEFQDWNDPYWNRFIKRKYGVYIEDEQYTIDDFKGAFATLVEQSVDESLKDEEWETLVDPTQRKPDEFLAEVNNTLSTHGLSRFFDKIVLIKKLTEVIAVRDFTRIHPPTRELPPSKTEYEKFASAAIREDNEDKWAEIKSDMDKRWELPEPKGPFHGTAKRADWLPAVKNRGEGIFIVFNRDKLSLWEGDKLWQKRVKEMSENANYISQLDGFQENYPRSLLIHTFSHLLAIEIAKECGYQLASIRERLYCSKSMHGLLLYTSTPDSQGSLGGLTSQAQDLDILAAHLDRVKEAARLCSQDPLCGEHKPSNTERPWGASCHSCTNMPETSCEALMNQFLDRRTIIGSGQWTGYFD